MLGDPATRRKCDDLGANWRMCEQGEAPGGGSPFGGRWPPRRGGGGGGAGFRTMSPEEMEDVFGDANPFSDFFTTFFGGRTGGQPPRGAATRAGAIRP